MNLINLARSGLLASHTAAHSTQAFSVPAFVPAGEGRLQGTKSMQEDVRAKPAPRLRPRPAQQNPKNGLPPRDHVGVLRQSLHTAGELEKTCAEAFQETMLEAPANRFIPPEP